MLAAMRAMCSRSHRASHDALTVSEPVSGDDTGATNTKENA